ncbi:hypothetical protein C7448_10589 [Tenacibaculum gallaicum]|uniref:Uncharacterized protein n=1 Tax=Tenacibaculum gallaicum TaxID=561505 RepID=A0A3E0HQW6_9FLAO|nr:hypothetical protein [Tenacibaculum gallaicum]REH48809.1 hypothetical protein C7448_10589 [Tenacibaculum gallaicum]
MKLDQVKQLGKELTKKELKRTHGGRKRVGYTCNNGIMGVATGEAINIATEIESFCGGGYRINFVRPIEE